MAVNIKDLYGNLGKRLKKINNRYNFQQNTPYLIYFAMDRENNLKASKNK